MELQSYFEPISFDSSAQGSLASLCAPYHDDLDLKSFQVAIIFVNETKWSGNEEGFERAANEIVHAMDRLYLHESGISITILGMFKSGNTIGDTESGMSEVIAHLLRHKVCPVVLSNDRALTYSLYKAFAIDEQISNITSIDAFLNVEDSNGPGYVGRIIKEQPNYLFNYSNLGYQTYLVSPGELQLSEDLFFESNRLGLVRGSIASAEPVLRGADIVACSMNALKAADFSSSSLPQPNGIFAEEACQLMRYAGITDVNKVLLISDIDWRRCSENGVDTLLLAEMIWCYIDGFHFRKPEMPGLQKEGFLKYRVPLRDDEFQLIFYKSLNTDRWWMEVPVPPQYANKYRKHHMVPCDYSDYTAATSDDLPERWWKAYKKML